MRRFDFYHAARTSLGRPQRAAERSWRAEMSAAATVGTGGVGPAPLAHRAATSLVPARAHRHTGGFRRGPMGGIGTEFELWGRT